MLNKIFIDFCHFIQMFKIYVLIIVKNYSMVYKAYADHITLGKIINL